MLVREVMTAPVVTVSPAWTVKQAVRVLFEQDITAAPVVDVEGRMVGIVSEMDLLRGEFEGDPRAFLSPVALPEEESPLAVDDVMTPEVKTVEENADVLDVVDLMITTGVKSLPVMRSRILVGIVSRRDLLGMLAHGDQRVRDDVVEALKDLSSETGTWRVSVRDGVVELHGDGQDERSAHLAEVIARTVPGVTDVVRPP